MERFVWIGWIEATLEVTSIKENNFKKFQICFYNNSEHWKLKNLVRKQAINTLLPEQKKVNLDVRYRKLVHKKKDCDLSLFVSHEGYLV